MAGAKGKKRGAGETNSDATQEPLMIIKSERSEASLPDTIDYPPEFSTERMIAMFDAAMARGGRRDQKPTCSVVQINCNDATLETCGVIVGMGDNQYLSIFEKEYPFNYVMTPPKDKPRDSQWVKNVHSNFDIRTLIKNIKEENDPEDLLWLDNFLAHIHERAEPTHKEDGAPQPKKLKPTPPTSLPVKPTTVEPPKEVAIEVDKEEETRV